MEAMCGLKQSDAPGIFHHFFGPAEMEVFLVWAAVLIAAIVVAKALKKVVLEARTGGASAVQDIVIDDSDYWSSCSSDEDSEEELETENEDESGVEVGTKDEDDSWGWSWSNFWETGRDNVVRSWEEDSHGRVEGEGLVGLEEPKRLVSLWDRRREAVVQSFENPSTVLRDRGQLLRRRVVGLGARGEEKLWRLRSGYAGELPSIGRRSSTAAEDGRLEAAVVAWCRNAASCLPLLSPDKS